jgi:hypothetical protein
VSCAAIHSTSTLSLSLLQQRHLANALASKVRSVATRTTSSGEKIAHDSAGDRNISNQQNRRDRALLSSGEELRRRAAVVRRELVEADTALLTELTRRGEHRAAQDFTARQVGSTKPSHVGDGSSVAGTGDGACTLISALVAAKHAKASELADVTRAVATLRCDAVNIVEPLASLGARVFSSLHALGAARPSFTLDFAAFAAVFDKAVEDAVGCEALALMVRRSTPLFVRSDVVVNRVSDHVTPTTSVCKWRRGC